MENQAENEVEALAPFKGACVILRLISLSPKPQMVVSVSFRFHSYHIFAWPDLAFTGQETNHLKFLS